jgi:hypothetical protein
LTEERRLRVFENRVLRIIFRPEREEVTGEWRKLHNVEIKIHDQIEKNETSEACGTYGGEKRCIRGFGGEN